VSCARSTSSVNCGVHPRCFASTTDLSSAFFRQLARADLLVLDDFGLAPLADQTVRDLLEILDDRYDRKSTLITSQLPFDQWHAYLGDRTVADAILDRVIHNAYKLALNGASMRKQKSVASTRSRSSKAVDDRWECKQSHDLSWTLPRGPACVNCWPGIR
jgi:hypothetical protein